MFVEHGKIRVPVPLWGHYTVTWNGGDLEGSHWILVINYDRWVDALVDNITAHRYVYIYTCIYAYKCGYIYT